MNEQMAESIQAWKDTRTRSKETIADLDNGIRIYTGTDASNLTEITQDTRAHHVRLIELMDRMIEMSERD